MADRQLTTDFASSRPTNYSPKTPYLTDDLFPTVGILNRLPSLEDAVERTWTGFLVLDQECHIVRANPAAEALSGVHRHTLVGLRFCEAFGAEACAGCADDTCLFAHALEGKERRSNPRWVTLTRGGVSYSVLLSGTPLAASSNQDSRARGDRSSVAVTMVSSILIGEADRRRREMVAAGLHELRHAVSVQAIAVNALAEDSSSDLHGSARDAVASLRGATSYMMTALDDLLNRTLFDLGILNVRPRSIALWPLLQDVVARLTPLLQRRAQSIVLHVVSDLHAWVDPATLEHVLVNLLDNAHKYSVDGDKIVVTARALPHLAAVQISVRDHGPGIQPDERRRIFEPFYRPAHTRDKPGVGLGLAIVRSMIERQGGTVGIRSAPGGGALFWVRLPISAPNTLQQPQVRGDQL